MVRPIWGSVKNPGKISLFWVFKDNCYKIFLDLVLFWCKLSLFLLPRSWLFLLLLPTTPKIFLIFISRSWKILQNIANLANNNCQVFGKCQKSKKFLGKKTKTPSTGCSKWTCQLLKQFSIKTFFRFFFRNRPPTPKDSTFFYRKLLVKIYPVLLRLISYSHQKWFFLKQPKAGIGFGFLRLTKSRVVGYSNYSRNT